MACAAVNRFGSPVGGNLAMVCCLEIISARMLVTLLVFLRLEFSTELPKLQLVYARFHLKDIKMLTSSVSPSHYLKKSGYYPGFCAGSNPTFKQ